MSVHRVAHLCTVLTILAAGCGGSTPSSPAGPSPAPGPGTPPPAANQAPAVSSRVTPSWGIDSLTTFTFSATASDPEGDPLTVTWNFGDGTTATGARVQKTYRRGATFRVRATADDGKGGRTTAERDLVVGSMTGAWVGTIPGYTNLVFSLQQNGAVVTGRFVEQFFGEGRTDPAAPGRIDADGRVEIRFKLSRFSDFIFRGRMDSTGRRVTGGVYASGFNGESFLMVKQ